jgi:hypothetical protein
MYNQPKNSKWFVYFTETGKHHSGNGLKIVYYIQTWPSDVKKLKRDRRTHFWNYYLWYAEKLSTWLLSAGLDFLKNVLNSKHVLKVYFKHSRKNPDFLFLPLPSEPIWLKIATNQYHKYHKYHHSIIMESRKLYLSVSGGTQHFSFLKGPFLYYVRVKVWVGGIAKYLLFLTGVGGWFWITLT